MYRVTYAGLTEIPVAVCSECLAKERRSDLPTYLGFLAVGVFFTFFFSLYSLVEVVKRLRGSRSKGFIHDVTKPIVSAKALEIGLDRLFPPE